MFIVSIEYGQFCDSIVDDNKRFVEEMMDKNEWKGIQMIVVEKVDCPSDERCHNTQSGLMWRDIQRMTRLASSVKKVLLKAQLVGNFESLDPTVFNSIRECHLKLNLLRLDHWSPTEPDKFMNYVIYK